MKKKARRPLAPAVTLAALRRLGAKQINRGGHHVLMCDGAKHWVVAPERGGPPTIRGDGPCNCTKRAE